MFYKVTQRPTALAIRLSPKKPDRVFYPKWHITGQNIDFVAVTEDIPVDTIGLFLADGEAQYAGANVTAVPCVLLLVGEQKLFVPKQCVSLVSDKEIEKELNDEQKQTT